MPKIPPTGYWTFFCNTSKWEIDKFLEKHLDTDVYQISTFHTDDIKPGDKGVIRVGKDLRPKSILGNRPRLQAGIYAFVEVTSAPHMRHGMESNYWTSPPDSGRLVVDIHFTHNLIERPILLENIANTRGINDKYLLKGMQASSMPLDPETFHTILSLADTPFGARRFIRYEN
jgi:predicted RNA-binding protein with PUA-like domain